jgi:two-component system, sensor histidine kinase and response regulator
MGAKIIVKKILVIDDEEWLREMIQLALRQRGYEVIEAHNGHEGIEKARTELPDLILCDVNMGKVDGYLTLAALRTEAPTAAIPFILMTGLADNAGMRHGMELGADDYLPKPFTTDVLYAAVEARLKKSQTVRDEAERKLAHLRDNISLMMPHEMRTPLNGIISNAELLSTSAETLKPVDVAEMGQEILKSSQRLERLIENFLIYAQLELIAADPKNVNALRIGRLDQPAALISKVAGAQAAHASRSNDLVVEAVDMAVPMSGEYFSRVVDELVQNALKFSEAGSSVRVTLSEAFNGIELSVTDHGRGFSTEQIRRIGAYIQFDRKMQDQQGLGLGLTIAKRLAELHGGSLLIDGRKGSGTTVTVKLPKAKQD